MLNITLASDGIVVSDFILEAKARDLVAQANAAYDEGKDIGVRVASTALVEHIMAEVIAGHICHDQIALHLFAYGYDKHFSLNRYCVFIEDGTSHTQIPWDVPWYMGGDMARDRIQYSIKIQKQEGKIRV